MDADVGGLLTLFVISGLWVSARFASASQACWLSATPAIRSSIDFQMVALLQAAVCVVLLATTGAFNFINLWLIPDRHRYCTYLYY